MVADINTTAPGASSYPSYLTAAGNRVFFNADDGTHGDELWTSDGTTTHMVKDINTHSQMRAAGSAGKMVDVGGTLFFVASDGTDNGTTQHGQELWKAATDGSDANLVKDITPSGNSYISDLTGRRGTPCSSAWITAPPATSPGHPTGRAAGPQSLKNINSDGGQPPSTTSRPSPGSYVFFEAT